MTSNDLYYKAKQRFGVDHQTIICVEELSELQKELTKILRGKGDYMHLAEEIADVVITVEQMVQFYGIKNEVKQMKQEKLDRLEKTINA